MSAPNGESPRISYTVKDLLEQVRHEAGDARHEAQEARNDVRREAADTRAMLTTRLEAIEQWIAEGRGERAMLRWVLGLGLGAASIIGSVAGAIIAHVLR